ncbi:uncharacterized protein [Ptychodera flava]|uniref:uncharacterized protein n=1 Tax=Ptychodera flava TaxID=63121 RepID=UPI00396A9150
MSGTIIYILELFVLLVNYGTMIACEWSGNHRHSDGQGDTESSCSHEVLIREDTPVGKIIFSFHDQQNFETGNVVSNWSVLVRHTSQTLLSFESVRIIDGNKNDRFVINPKTQEISLYGYLDFDIDSEYTLTLLTENSQNASQTRCIIKITLEDVEGWPPYYNETCKMPTRGPRKGLDMPIALSLGKNKVPLETINPGINTTSLEVDSNNNKCMATMYLPIPETHGRLDFRRSDIGADVNGQEVQYQFFKERADFPPDALFNEEWFNIKNDDNTTHYSLLKLMITNINTKAPLMP